MLTPVEQSRYLPMLVAAAAKEAQEHARKVQPLKRENLELLLELKHLEARGVPAFGSASFN